MSPVPKEIAFPNESPAYRAARNELLRAEVELRSSIEKVAALRRTLPLGGEPDRDYPFDRVARSGSVEQVTLSQLFTNGHDTLFLYNFMYGPSAERPCPLCSSFLDALDAQVPHLEQRIAVAVAAKSPIARIRQVAREREWKHLPLLSSERNRFNRDYYGENEEGHQMPMGHVFVKKGGAIRHFWSSEMLYVPNESGDSRHIDSLWPLWNVLDLTPEGRGETWYPALEYEPVR